MRPSLIASASSDDHLRIALLIKQLDCNGRKAYVITLRRLPADYVAGSIRQLLFGGTEEKKKKKSYSYWDMYDSGRSSSSKEKKDQFRVDADVETNRLLFWASEYEMAQVKDFLESLGESPDDPVNRDTTRILDYYDDEEVKKLFEQLEKEWPRGEAPLIIEKPEEENPAKGSDSEPKKEESTTSPPADRQTQVDKHSPDDPIAQHVGPRIVLTKYSLEKPAESENNETRPPIVIRRNAAGRLVISSDDPKSLDRLEVMLARLAPPQRRYKIIPLTNAYADEVVKILKVFFKEDTGGPDTEDIYRAGWYGYPVTTSDKEEGVGLSRRRPLKFIADMESNSILVKDADPEQLRQVDGLVAFYDKPKSVDAKNVHQQGLIRIQYSKAKDIADSIKALYRDLLSPNDKAFENKKNGGNERGYTYIYRMGGGDDEDNTERAPRFKGLLSIGVDERSNTLLISSPPFLYDQVVKMIMQLDEAAKPTVATVSVVPLGTGINAAELQKALSKIVSESETAKKSTKESEEGNKEGKNRTEKR